MNLHVERAGFLTTVQDQGRVGHRASGVSIGGALDQHALRVANLLVRNNATTAGLEATLGTVRLRFTDDRLLAWCGGEFEAQIGTTAIPPGHTAHIRSGEEFHLSARGSGGRAWLAVSGGIDVPLVLGSRSTDLRSGFGGLEGRALKDGDVLKLAPSRRIPKAFAQARVSSWFAPNEWSRTKARHTFLQVVPGAKWSDFDAASLVGPTFQVAADSDRMGVRLAGPVVERKSDAELISEPVAPGTIQVPPSGQPIILLGDCQTIGGYPKIAHVITVDLAVAAQLRPGDAVRFAEVSLDQAQRPLLEREREVERFRLGLELQGVWT